MHIQDIFNHTLSVLDASSKRAAATREPSSFAPVEGSSSPCADTGTAGVSGLYPVTCGARYYEAASRILEEEGQLFDHDNCNELGALIQQWIDDARDNWEPRS